MEEKTEFDGIGSWAQARAAGYVLGQRIKVVKPAGTAGKPSKYKGYARVIDNYSATSRAIAPDEVPEYQALIDRGREVVRLQRQRSALIERVDLAGSGVV
jgi:hypothetical protein